MTVAVIVAGLVPIMVGSGTGSEIVQRIAARMVGGMINCPLTVYARRTNRLSLDAPSRDSEARC
jgi:Cu/Ag efflux pump CusA